MLSVIKAKLEAEKEFEDGYPVTIRQLDAFFRDIQYELNGMQLNTLFLENFKAGKTFKTSKLISWVKKNFSFIKRR